MESFTETLRQERPEIFQSIDQQLVTQVTEEMKKDIEEAINSISSDKQY